MILEGLLDRKRRAFSGSHHRTASRARLISVVMAATAAAIASPVPAQDYPSQTIKIISSVSAGGTLDIFARAFADELQKRWGQPAIVDPRPGGNFTIAGRACASAAPDGYTVCMVTGDILVYNEFLIPKLPY